MKSKADKIEQKVSDRLERGVMPVAPAGYIIIPKMPTVAMIEAGKKVGEYPFQLHALRNPQLVFVAMIKAYLEEKA